MAKDLNILQDASIFDQMNTDIILVFGRRCQGEAVLNHLHINQTYYIGKNKNVIPNEAIFEYTPLLIGNDI